MATADDLNEKAYEAKKRWHEAQRHLPIKEKMRIFLELQKADLPLIAKKRPLRPHERPWPVEP